MLLNYRRLPIFISHIYMCAHKNKCKYECNDYTKKIVYYWVTKSRRYSITPKNLVVPLIIKRFSNLNGKSTILSRKLLTKKYILFVCPKERLFPATNDIKQLCNYPTHKTALESWKNQRTLSFSPVAEGVTFQNKW